MMLKARLEKSYFRFSGQSKNRFTFCANFNPSLWVLNISLQLFLKTNYLPRISDIKRAVTVDPVNEM